MKYKYYLGNGNLLAESNSEISFNLDLFPAFKEIKPVVEEPKKKKRNYYDNNEEDN